MIEDFPVPLEFELPGPAWRPVVPADYGVEAAFLALRPEGDHPTYTPTITIAGALRHDPAPLEEISDEGVARMAVQSVETVVLDRKRIGYEFAPAALQLLRSTVNADAGLVQVRTIHMTLGFEDPDDERRRAVVTIVFSCAEEQFDSYGREFQDFCESLRLVPPSEPEAGEQAADPAGPAGSP